jgi:hypothetical protein
MPLIPIGTNKQEGFKSAVCIRYRNKKQKFYTPREENMRELMFVCLQASDVTPHDVGFSPGGRSPCGIVY